MKFNIYLIDFFCVIYNCMNVSVLQCVLALFGMIKSFKMVNKVVIDVFVFRKDHF